MLNGEKFESIPLKSEMRQGCPRSLLCFNIVLQILTGSVRQEKETKGIKVGMRSLTITIYRWCGIMY